MKTVLAATLLLALAGPLAAQNSQNAPAMKASPVASAAAVQWGAAPPVLPAGAQLAVLSGDPAQPGALVLRLRFPDGYAVAAHHHPTDEYVTVLQGKLHFGMGDKADRAKTMTIGVGGFGLAPADHNHFVFAEGETIVQINTVGPFQLIYANPADDPSKK